MSTVRSLVAPSAANKRHVPNYQVDKAEFHKCINDAEYFIENYCYIQHPVKGRVPFKMYEFQREALKRFQQHRLNSVLKSRQMGFSTLMAAFIFWNMLRKPGFVALVLANKEHTAKNVLKKVRYMIMELEKEQKAGRCKIVLPWPWRRFTKRNVKNIVMPNNSEIICEAAGPEPSRSESVSLVAGDECAVIEKFEEKWGALAPIITTGGNCILCSTPRGAVGKFYDVCINATMDTAFLQKFNIQPTCSAAGTNGFNLLTIPYFVHPERDEAWLNDECRRLQYDDRQRAEEFLASFLASGETLVGPERITAMEQSIVAPLRMEGPGDACWIWEDPLPNFTYMLVSDVAEGAGQDFSAFHIIKLETGEEVAEYKGKMPTYEYSEFLVTYGRKYGDAAIVVERTGPGIAVIGDLIRFQYPLLYYTPQADALKNAKQSQKADDIVPFTYFYNPVTNLYIAGKPGFVTDVSTRPLALNRLAYAIQEGALKIRSMRLIDELKTFVWNARKGRYEAASGHNDDLVMSLAIAAYVLDIAVQKLQLSTAYVQAMLIGTSKDSRNMPDNVRSNSPDYKVRPTDTLKTQFDKMRQNQKRQYEVNTGAERFNLLKEFGFEK